MSANLRIPLSRAAFSLVLAVSILWAGEPVAAGSPDGITEPLDIEKIAPGVFVHHGRLEVWHPDNAGDIANLGFIVGERCVAVIDTGSTLAIGTRLLAAIRTRTDKPVCFVINTHAHPDHLLGNVAFEAEKPVFLAHANMAGAIATRGPNYLKAVERDLGPAAAGTRLVPAGQPVAGETRIDLGERVLLLKAWPTSHTNADLTIYDETSRTLWLGDLAFVGHLPVVDGKLLGWLETLDALRAIPALRAVPGHGRFDRPGWPDMLAAQQTYLVALRDAVRKAIADGGTLTEALATIGAGEQASWSVYDEFHKRNISAAFAELEWE